MEHFVSAVRSVPVERGQMGANDVYKVSFVASETYLGNPQLFPADRSPPRPPPERAWIKEIP